MFDFVDSNSLMITFPNGNKIEVCTISEEVTHVEKAILTLTNYPFVCFFDNEYSKEVTPIELIQYMDLAATIALNESNSVLVV